ncbi:MAG: diguanylate cyclase [Oscillospiraceae bacterium]|nr:diguanylate cyclase [Oscillospiraceae bacterium]
MKKSAKKQMVLFLYLLLLIVYIVIASVYNKVVTDSRKIDEFMVSETAASFAALEINSDEAKEYHEHRNPDANYQIHQKKLMSFAQENKINRISLILYKNTVGYYIYDTENSDALGKKVAYDDYASTVKSDLIECRKQWNVTRNNKNYTYRPLRTKEDSAAGYIIIETDIPATGMGFKIVGISAFSIVILFFVSWIAVFSLKRSVFDPIETFARAASAFTGSDEGAAGDEELKRKFETGRGDEIGHLGESIISMINVINSSRKNFSSAVFDATHDGMTKTYNKRHYENKVESFRSCSSICVIYFDVNNLKLINDTLGHERGDYVIKRAAEYIKEVSFEDSMCFRMGGDEFLLVVTNHSYREIYALINRLDADCPVILSAETDSIKCSVAYGYAYAKASYSYDQLLAEAEENMYRKKYEIKQQLNMPER